MKNISFFTLPVSVSAELFFLHYTIRRFLSCKYEPLTQGNRVRNELCVLRNKSLSRERKQPTFLFIRAIMAEEEVAALVVDNDSCMCKAGFCW